MKVSKYNLIKKLPNSENYLVFNSVNCALVELEQEYIDILMKIERAKLDANEELAKKIEDLEMVGLIIPDEDDEVGRLKYFHNRHKFSKETLSITIAPTLDCNFVCPYCFENKKKGKMNKNVKEKLISLVEANSHECKNLEVIWYGGEPLLALDVIESLYNEFSDIAKRNNLNYKSFMITNGYLINERVIEKLKYMSISSIQITLDGAPDINNKRRKLKNSNLGTFDKIIENIQLLNKNNIDVVIRVNIDKINYSHMTEFLDVLVERDLTNAKIAFGHVLPYNEICSSIESTCFTKEEYATAIYDLQVMLNERKFKYDKFITPQPKCVYCTSVGVNSFLVDPEGYLYKCWCNVGNIEDSYENIMNLSDDTVLSDILNYKNSIVWTNFSPFENDDCIKCKLLPICMGGCPKRALESNKKNSCDFWKYNIEKMMDYMYYVNQNNEVIEE